MLKRKIRTIRRYRDTAERDYITKMIFLETARNSNPLTEKQRDAAIKRAKKDYAAIIKAVQK